MTAASKRFCIDGMVVYIHEDQDGDEGLVAYREGHTFIPMAAADAAREASLDRIAHEMVARKPGMVIRKVRFTGRVIDREFR